MRSKYFKWTPEIDEQFLKLRAEGFDNAAIAHLLGCSHNSAKHRASKLIKADKLVPNLYPGYRKDDNPYELDEFELSERAWARKMREIEKATSI